MTNSIMTGKKNFPGCEIVLISTKPSPARWKLKENYIEVNLEFKKLADQQNNVEFVSIWDIMLNRKENPKLKIFISDRLHMNKKGYKL